MCTILLSLPLISGLSTGHVCRELQSVIYLAYLQVVGQIPVNNMSTIQPLSFPIFLRKILFFFFTNIFYFIYLFLAVLGLHYCVRAFSNCGDRELLFVEVCGLLTAVASLVVEHGLQAHGLQQLWRAGSVVVVHGLSCSKACGIFLDQGLNPCTGRWILNHCTTREVP